MKRYRDKKHKYIKISIAVIIIIGALIFTTYSLRQEGNMLMIEKTIKDVTSFIGQVLYAPVEFIHDKIEVYQEREKVYVKYKNLQEQMDDVNQKEARIKELEKENKELRDMLKIDSSLSDYDQIPVTIVSRDVGYWYDLLTINKGSKAGVTKKMAVVTTNGLIGYISDVSAYSSNVQLLTTKNLPSKISVKIDLGNGKYAMGLLNGYNNGLYTIEGISSGDIPLNAYVTTTGLSDSFPSGILIGYVKNITTDNFDLGKIVEVTPSVNYENIEYVNVLKRKAMTP